MIFLTLGFAIALCYTHNQFETGILLSLVACLIAFYKAMERTP